MNINQQTPSYQKQKQAFSTQTLLCAETKKIWAERHVKHEVIFKNSSRSARFILVFVSFNLIVFHLGNRLRVAVVLVATRKLDLATVVRIFHLSLHYFVNLWYWKYNMLTFVFNCSAVKLNLYWKCKIKLLKLVLNFKSVSNLT